MRPAWQDGQHSTKRTRRLLATLRQHRQRWRLAKNWGPFSDADGADGMSRARMYSDDPAAGVALTAKGDLDAERTQGGLRAPQAAGERAGIFGPASAAA